MTNFINYLIIKLKTVDFTSLSFNNLHTKTFKIILYPFRKFTKRQHSPHKKGLLKSIPFSKPYLVIHTLT